jgi:hypothetical protein
MPLAAPCSYDALKKVLEDKLGEYNETNAVMELVLFQQAMEHVTRIARIIDLPRGNAMLVGVGGSGKQSLARLAAFICGYEVFQVGAVCWVCRGCWGCWGCWGWEWLGYRWLLCFPASGELG